MTIDIALVALTLANLAFGFAAGFYYGTKFGRSETIEILKLDGLKILKD